MRQIISDRSDEEAVNLTKRLLDICIIFLRETETRIERDRLNPGTGHLQQYFATISFMWLSVLDDKKRRPIIGKAVKKL